MRTIIWFIYFWLYLLVSLPRYYHVKRLEKQGQREEHDRLVRHYVGDWASRLLRLAGAKVETTGRENIPQGPVVFVGNHQGYFDIPLMITQMDKPNPLVAKKEIQKIPMIRSWMEELRCIFIDRQDARQSMDCLKRAQELLKEGYSVVIFPEGTRSHDYSIGEFKAGAFKMATKARATIIPVAIQNSRRLLEDPRGFGITDVYFKILPPIETRNMDEDELRLIHEKVEKEIRSAYETLRRV